MHDRHLPAHLVEDVVDATTASRIVFMVDAEVEDGELQLPHHLHGRLEVARFHHALIEVIRQFGAGLEMAGDEVQGLALPAPVLHELAGQFHRVPGHAADAGHRQVIDAGEHVVQAVAELVEQGGHLVVGEQGRLRTDGWREIAGQVGHRGLHLLVAHPA